MAFTILRLHSIHMTYDAALEPYDAALEPYGAALDPYDAALDGT